MKKTKNKSNRLGIILFLVFLLFFVSGLIIIGIKKRPKPIPEGAIGNTSGNLNNRGLFCESDGYVYFSNVYDQRKLYKMKSDGTEAECIADVPAEFINVAGDRVFFYQTPLADNQVFGLGGLYGVCYTDINGKSGMHNVDKAIINSLLLYGPYLYYQHYDNDEGLTLYKADTKTGEKTLLSDKRIYVSTPYNGKLLTYNMDNNFFLSAFNPDTLQLELVDQEARAYNIIQDGQYIYYMNIDDSYKIYRMNISNYEKEKLTDCTVDLFNVYGDNIFYQRSGTNGQTPALIHTTIYGGSEDIVAEGTFTNINCTSVYTYFHEFSEASPIYRVPTSGGQAEVFNP